MRSRLEAYFAQSLDGLADWEYEPCCFASPAGQYLPDFRVTFSAMDRIYVEVKPTVQTGLEAAPRMEIILATEPNATLSVYAPKTSGTPPPDFQLVAQKWGHSGRWKFPQGVA